MIEIKKDGASVFTTTSDTETEAVGESFGHAVAGDPNTFVALYGDLGAGKTAFVRGMAKVLSPESIVRSPTYTVVNEYRRGTLPVFHFDLYRITDPDDLYSVGYHDYIGSGICVAEWAERAEDELPTPRYSVRIDKTGDSERRITITYIKNQRDIC